MALTKCKLRREKAHVHEDKISSRLDRLELETNADLEQVQPDILNLQ